MKAKKSSSPDRISVGILGGTFNPVHMGHLMLAEQAREELSLDQVMFLPSGVSYMKREQHILSGEDRLKMVRLAIQDNPAFICSDLEIQKTGNTYTWETLRSLKGLYPQQEFTFLMGADSLFQIESWRYPERIFAACRVAAAVREGMDEWACRQKAEELKARFDADIVILQAERIDISSTQIRENCASGRSIRYLVPEVVREWILDNHLYAETGA